MISGKAHTTTGFKLLFNSVEFLNNLLNSLTCCILFLNDKLELQAYNNSLDSMFPYLQNKDKLLLKCGDVIGCAFNVDEEKECGMTSHCNYCELREAALKTYVTHETVFKKKFNRPFYTSENEKEIKNLIFTTRIFEFNSEKYILMIIDENIN